MLKILKYVVYGSYFIYGLHISSMKRNCIDNNSGNDDYDVINKSKHNKLTYSEHKTVYDNIKKEIMQREVTMANVLKLNLPINEYIWFSEYLDILKQTPPCTEDRYRISEMIYKKLEENLKM